MSLPVVMSLAGHQSSLWQLAKLSLAMKLVHNIRYPSMCVEHGGFGGIPVPLIGTQTQISNSGMLFGQDSYPGCNGLVTCKKISGKNKLNPALCATREKANWQVP